MQENDFYCGSNETERQGQIHSSSEGEARTRGKPRILIIEDEFFVAWNLQSILSSLNFEVCDIASDAESGVDLAIRQEAELLLVDVNLGGGPDGVEAVRRILEYRNVAAIFITAYTDQDNLRRIRQVAPEAPVLSKPVSIDLLLSTVGKLFPPK